MNKYTIFMYIYDDYLKYKEQYKSINDFLCDELSLVIKHYNENIKNNPTKTKDIHYNYYKLFNLNVIKQIQCKTNETYIPNFRLLLMNEIKEKTFGVHRFGWMNVIQNYIKQSYYEYDEFYFKNPDFEWVSYANEYNLDDYESAKAHFLNNDTQSLTSSSTLNEKQIKYKKMKYIIFDEWIERKYLWGNEIKPIYKYPFISFIHDPPYYDLPDNLLDKSRKDVKYLLEQNPGFLREKENLRILITMSEYYKKYITHHFLLPENTTVETLYHPLEITETKNMFNLEKYMENENKELFIIGWWLRRYDRFLNLSCKKCILIKGLEGNHINEYIVKNIRNIIHSGNNSQYNGANKYELSQYEIQILKTKYNTYIYDYLENEKYDTLFHKNIIFLDVYNSAANNIVLECIMNNTPLLVNNNVSIVEYLGENYPFYFTNYEDAERKGNDLELIIKTHNYLKNMDKTRFTYHYFNCELNKIIMQHL
jgi:hypothetical protein